MADVPGHRGDPRAYTRVIVKIPGKAYRVRAAAYHKAFDDSAAMRKAAYRQNELPQAENRQAIACHGLHDVKARFNRCLLECHDLSGGLDDMPLKQEFLALMLGVSRTAITRIALVAQHAGLIEYRAGRSRSSIGRDWKQGRANVAPQSSFCVASWAPFPGPEPIAGDAITPVSKHTCCRTSARCRHRYRAGGCALA